MSPARRDAILLGLCGAAVITLGIIFNLAEICSKLAARYESWQLDEVWVAVVVLGLASLVYCGFRLRELRKAREALACLAVRDDLTGIGNRRRFFAELREGLSTLQRDERCIVALLDLNNFKLINDFYGHRVGDEVLREIAHRLKGLVGNTGSVARIGGDEFGVLVPAATRREPPSEFAQRVLALFDQPIKLASLSLDVKTSVGIATHAGALLKSDALAAQDGSSAETVLRQADMALYQAKRQGTRYCLFNAEMDERLRHKIELESDFGSALANGEIVPYYQPIVNLRSGAIVGCEALARLYLAASDPFQPAAH